MSGQRDEGPAPTAPAPAALEALDATSGDDLFPAHPKGPEPAHAAPAFEGGPDDLFWGRTPKRTGPDRPRIEDDPDDED